MPYYCLCSYPPYPDSIVQKGNWGRINNIKKIDNKSLPLLLEELIFEKVRLEKYPNRPSRFNSNFLCSNSDSARNLKIFVLMIFSMKLNH